MFCVINFAVAAISADCPNMINLAKGMRLDINQPLVMNKITTNCCSSGTGITCVNGRVTEIDWSLMSLDGSINGTLLTSAIKLLALNNNQLTGRISFSYPSTLLNLALNNNNFNGTLPTTYPSGLVNLILGNNKLSGVIPETIRGSNQISLSNNLLTGSIPSLPKRLSSFYAYGNMLSGTLPLFPTSLKILWLGTSNNGNKLAGTLTLYKPTSLYAVGNYVTDVVITNDSLLTSCDLSDNPLLGSKNLESLPMCTKIGLYYATTSTLQGSTAMSTTMTKSAGVMSVSVLLPVSTTIKGSTIAHFITSKVEAISDYTFEKAESLLYSTPSSFDTSLPSIAATDTAATTSSGTTSSIEEYDSGSSNWLENPATRTLTDEDIDATRNNTRISTVESFVSSYLPVSSSANSYINGTSYHLLHSGEGVTSTSSDRIYVQKSSWDLELQKSKSGTDYREKSVKSRLGGSSAKKSSTTFQSLYVQNTVTVDYIPSSSTTMVIVQAQSSIQFNGTLVYLLFGAFFGLCAIVLVISFFLKHPTVATKGGRKSRRSAAINSTI